MMLFSMRKRFQTSLSLAKNPFAVECIRYTPGRQFPAVFHQVTLSMAAPQGQPKGAQHEQLLKGLPNIVLMWHKFPPMGTFVSILKHS